MRNTRRRLNSLNRFFSLLNASYFLKLLGGWPHGGLRVLRGNINGFSEEARILGFASLTLVRVAFVA
jgi:hypothetical protein